MMLRPRLCAALLCVLLSAGGARAEADLCSDGSPEVVSEAARGADEALLGYTIRAFGSAEVRVYLPEAQERELRQLLTQLQAVPPMQRGAMPICVKKGGGVEPSVIVRTREGLQFRIPLEQIAPEGKPNRMLPPAYTLGEEAYRRLCELVSPEQNRALIDNELRQMNEGLMAQTLRTLAAARGAERVLLVRCNPAAGSEVLSERELPQDVEAELRGILAKLRPVPAEKVLSINPLDLCDDEPRLMLQLVRGRETCFLDPWQIRSASKRDEWWSGSMMLESADLARLFRILEEGEK